MKTRVRIIFFLVSSLAVAGGMRADTSPRRPVLDYATYLGELGDTISAVAVGPDNNIYVAGVKGTSEGSANPSVLSTGPGQVFVARFAANGSTLLYMTYLGSGNADDVRALAVDSVGNAYIAGETSSINFPIKDALQPSCMPNSAGVCVGNAFVAKLNPQGGLAFSTYLGGSGENAANAIALDSSGNIYVAGRTNSTNFPVLHAAQSASAGGGDGFVAKIAADGSRIEYATYLGGSGADEIRGIAVDISGNAYLTGVTHSDDFPTQNALQPGCHLGPDRHCVGEAFVTKISADGWQLLYSTYLGGAGGDAGNAIAVDGAGNVFVTGTTRSRDFPLFQGLQTALGGQADAFVAKLVPDGSQILFSTYLGGTDQDQANSIAIDTAGNIVVTGVTYSPNFPTEKPVQKICQENLTGHCSGDAFVAVLNANGTVLGFATYLGGSGVDVSRSVAVDSTGAIYLAGATTSPDFPQAKLAAVPTSGIQVFSGSTGSASLPSFPSAATTGGSSLQPFSGGGFMAKITGALSGSQSPSPNATVACSGQTISWTGSSGDNQWTTSGNWSPTQVPISTDSVCIDSTFSGVTITIGTISSSTNQTISSLTANSAITFNGGPLTISGASTFANTLTIQSGTLTLTGAGSMLGAMTISGGTLAGSGNVSVTGLLTWSAGTVQGTAASVALNANGGISFPSSSNVVLATRTLVNNGTATWSGAAGQLTMSNGALVNNPGSPVNAVWNLQNDSSILCPSPLPCVDIRGSGGFANGGIFEKTGGTGTSAVNSVFSNSGSVQVNTGTLNFGGGEAACGIFAPCPGSWSVGSGNTLQFSSGTFAESGPFSGAGIVNFSGGGLTLTGTYNITGGTMVTGGTANFSFPGTVTVLGPLTITGGLLIFGTRAAGGISTSTMTQTGGILAGGDSLTISGLFTWSGGTQCTGIFVGSCSAPVPTNAITTANGGIIFPASSSPQLNNRTLVNNGAANWSGAAGNLFMSFGAQVINPGSPVNATWNLQNDSSIVNGGGTGQFFTNSGIFQKTGGTGTSTVNSPVAFNNTGSVQVNIGTLNFGGGGNCGSTCGGSWSVGSGNALQFSSGTFALSGPVVGGGTVNFFGGTETLTGTYNITGGTMVTGGTANFTSPGTVTSVGPLSLTAGVLNFTTGGAGGISTSTMTQSSGTLVGTDNLTISGPFTWSGGMQCTGFIMGTCVAGSLNATSTANGGIIFPASSSPQLNNRTLVNNGTATWSGAAGQLTMSNGALVNNPGSPVNAVWNLQNDSSILNGGGTGQVFTNGGIFQKTGGTGTSFVNTPIAFNNTGTARVNTGTLNFSGPFTQTAGSTVLNGGNISSTQTMNIQGGTLIGTGTITGSANNSGGAIAPGFSPGTINLTGSSSGNYTQGASGTYNVEIGGLTAGTQFDQVNLSGASGGIATLNGTLNVSLITAFTPSNGNSFTIMTYNSHTGTFATTNFPTLAGGLTWNITYNPTSVVLSVGGLVPASIAATSGTPQSAVINTAFAAPLVATVKDAGGNPVAGVTVTFTAPSTGASGSFTGGLNTATTDASGAATSATFTANGIAGSYTVTAIVAGVATPANFALTNTAGAATSITATSGTPQSAVINTAFAAPLVATVKDAGGNPVAGVTVTFIAPSTGASGSFAGGVNTAVTNASGVATSAVFTANGTAGSYTVTASVAGVATPANFALTNTTGAAASITATSGTPQSAVINTAFAAPLVATVKNAGGNPVAGVTVTFTAPSTGASGSFAGGVNTAVTNTSGVATSAVFTANGTAGSYTVTAIVAGVATPANFLLTNVAPPTITKVFGAASIPLNGTTMLTFTINNPNAGTALTGLAFTDTLPAGLVVGTPNGLTGGCGGATITATAGSSSVSLAGATLAASASCSFSVSVTGTTAGVKNNTTGAVTSTEGGTGGVASASVTVVGPPTITKVFGAASIPLNATTSLTFTITNPNAGTALTGVGFSDSLPSGLVIGTPNGLTGTCGGGMITAVAGSGVVSLTGATLAASASCSFSVSVTGTTAGVENNSVMVAATNGGTGNTSNASLTVVAPAVTLSPTSLTFAGQLITTTSSAQSVTLTNSGTAPLTISSIAITGTNASDFAQTNTCPASSATLAVNANCTISVTFTPSATGNRTASVTTMDNASGNPHAVSLAGTGTDFSLDAASGSNCPSGGNCSTSATISAGQTATYNLQVTPSNGFNGAVALACSGALGNSTCTVSPASLPPAGSTSYAFTVTVGNTSNVMLVPQPRFRGTPGMPNSYALLLLPILVFAFWAAKPGFTHSYAHRALVPAMAALFLCVLYSAACSGGGGGGGHQPPTNAVLKVTGTSNGVNRTLSLNLTVNH